MNNAVFRKTMEIIRNHNAEARRNWLGSQRNISESKFYKQFFFFK